MQLLFYTFWEYMIKATFFIVMIIATALASNLGKDLYHNKFKSKKHGKDKKNKAA